MNKQKIITILVYGTSAAVVLYIMSWLMEEGHKWLWGY
jgi:hypothetical protein